MDDLAHGEAHLKQLAAVQGGALLDRSAVGRGEAQPVDELAEEEGHAVLQLVLGRQRGRPRGDLLSCARDDLLGVRGQELVEHRPRLLHAPHTARQSFT
jgi:hypothetical protein